MTAAAEQELNSITAGDSDTVSASSRRPLGVLSASSALQTNRQASDSKMTAAAEQELDSITAGDSDTVSASSRRPLGVAND
jgi:DNA topoisomerase IA